MDRLFVMILVFTIFIFCGGSMVPKEVKNHKEFFLGLILGFCLHQGLVSVEGMGCKNVDKK